ncbi:hypothetical protein DFR50_13831 [Roseiarcus fermentans]|uniref:Secreted protein n=1 Tax=Roseiarcus fermentans TaxID=1473586 RepID=A0A366EQG5_9HYPH|nr:hypothetical protein DFR50_13831 [Roseiarcus fermentans]
MTRRWSIRLVAIASLAAGAPLAMAAMGGLAPLLPRSSEPGYLLYPRLGLCAPSVAGADEAAKFSPRRSAAFRPARTAGAVMPPGLGEHLSPERLKPTPLRTAGE